jgi:hypothetical protein
LRDQVSQWKNPGVRTLKPRKPLFGIRGLHGICGV